MKKSKNKNIISKTLFRNSFVLFMFLQLAVAFSSCNNLVNENEEKTESTLLKISVSSASTARERTALPSFSLTSISGYQFTIEGKKAGSATFEALKTETNTSGIYESLSDLQAAAFPVEPGDWTFKLTASKDGSVLSDQINKTISAGSNSLAFDLVWEDSNLSGTGSLSFTLDFSAAATKSNVARATGQLYSYNIASATESELSDSDYAEKTLTNSAGIVNYSLTNLAAGNYRIKIRLYDDKSNLILTWPELAIITGDQQSSKERQITALNPVYTIDFAFNCSDYSLDSGITLPEQYTRFTYDSDWPLPNADQLSRTGYSFEGWYTKADFTGDSVTSIPAGSTGNLHFYAQWVPNMDTPYTVKYFQQNIDDDEYTEVTDDTDVLYGTTGSDTEAKARSYTGFTAKTFSQEPINADGSTAVDIYYDRNTYTIIYDDGVADETITVPNDSTQYRYGANATINFTSPPARKGYTFLGWKEENKDTIYTTDGTNSIEIPSNNITLYAQWKAITYNIKYISEGSDITATTECESFPKTYTIESPEIALSELLLSKTDSTFYGWYDNSAYTGDTVSSINTGTTEDITLYAKWLYQQSISVTIQSGSWTSESTSSSFRLTYGSEELLEGQTITNNSDEITLTATEITGYTYTWKVDGNTTDSSGTLYSSDNTLTITTTNWKKGVYDISVIASNGTDYQSCFVQIKVGY